MIRHWQVTIPQLEHCCHKCFVSLNCWENTFFHISELLTAWRDKFIVFFPIMSCSCKEFVLLLHFQHMLHFLGTGCLFVVQQVSMAPGHTPPLQCRSGWTQRTARRWFNVLPVLTTSSEGDAQQKTWTMLILKSCACPSIDGCRHVTWLWPRVWWVSRPAPHIPCFSDPEGIIALWGASSSATALMWYGSNSQQPPT